MKLFIQLDHEALVQAVDEFLSRRIPNAKVQHVEYLDEDQMWRARLEVVEVVEDAAAPVSALVVNNLTHSDRIPGQTSDNLDRGALEGGEDGGEFGDGEDLPPLDEADLAKLGIDLSTPEGKMKAREARRDAAAHRNRRIRDTQPS